MNNHLGLKIFALIIGIAMMAMAWAMFGMGDNISSTLLVLGGGILFAISQISPPSA